MSTNERAEAESLNANQIFLAQQLQRFETECDRAAHRARGAAAFRDVARAYDDLHGAGPSYLRSIGRALPAYRRALSAIEDRAEVVAREAAEKLNGCEDVAAFTRQMDRIRQDVLWHCRGRFPNLYRITERAMHAAAAGRADAGRAA